MPASESGVDFRFRRGMSIGSIEAETDRELLFSSFVDTGLMDALLNTNNPQAVVVGRTGAGKTALLMKLEERDRVIRIKPDSVSARHLTASTIIPVLVQSGVRLNLFYKLFWRHVVVVAILKRHYHIDDEVTQAGFLTKALGAMTRKSKKQAIEYLREWSTKFWADSQEVAREVTETLENSVRAKVGTDTIQAISAELGAGASQSTRLVRDFRQKAQDVVSSIQVDKLEAALDILRDEALADEGRPYYVVIDDLDKDWIEASYAYDLIEALIEEVGEFSKLPNVKIVVALRENIIEAIMNRRDGRRGRQREKYQNRLLRVDWTEEQLESLLDRRLRALIRGTYGGTIGVKELLPKGGKNRLSGLEWLMLRSSGRPRDLIQFINECIKKCEGGTRITREVMKEVEPTYSRLRYQSVIDEWQENYPGLETIIDALKEVTDGSELHQLGDDRFVPILVLGEQSSLEPSICHDLVAARLTDLELKARVIDILFRVGVVGIKLSGKEKIRFCYEEPDLLFSGVPNSARIYVHPAFYRVLSVQNPHFERQRL